MSEKKAIINDFTTGSIPRKLFSFSIPFMASNAMQVLYALVDMLIVGKFVGKTGLSAVSTASQVFTFVTMICLGFCTGGQVYISQLIGAGKKDKLNDAIGTLFTIVTLIGILMTAICLIFRDEVLMIMNTPQEAYAYAIDYLLVCGCGVIFTYGYNLVAAILKGMGDSKHPFIFILIASLINVVLDYVFIRYLNMAVFGAALATILGQAFSVISALIYLYSHKEQFYFDFRKESFKIDRASLSVLLKLGIPFAIQSGAINISMLFVNSLVNSVSVTASATYGVGMKIDDIVNKVTGGISFAVSGMVGQNFAARKHDRVRSIVTSAWLFASVFYILFTILLITNSQMMFGFFTSDPDVIALAPTFVSAVVISFPAMVLMRGTNGFLQGIGNAKLSLIFALLDGIVFRIGFSYLFGILLNMGFYGFVLGFALAPYGTSIPAALYFFSGKWKSFTLEKAR